MDNLRWRISSITCGAGESVEPRVERGFASETLGTQFRNEVLARNAGDSSASRNPLARFTGSTSLWVSDPGVMLAKPRSTPGYILTPASQVSRYPRLHAYNLLRRFSQGDSRVPRSGRRPSWSKQSLKGRKMDRRNAGIRVHLLPSRSAHR